jgi:pilus assembly protein Flp/PilA
MTIDILRELSSNDDGQAMVEYAFLLALIAAVVVGVLQTIGTDVNAIFEVVEEGF